MDIHQQMTETAHGLERYRCIVNESPRFSSGTDLPTDDGFFPVVEIFFLNQNLAYEHREPRRGAPNAPEAILAFDWDHVPVRLSLYDANAERQARRSDVRARLAAVEALLHADEPPAE